jgi:hypothetical protein
MRVLKLGHNILSNSLFTRHYIIQHHIHVDTKRAVKQTINKRTQNSGLQLIKELPPRE